MSGKGYGGKGYGGKGYGGTGYGGNGGSYESGPYGKGGRGGGKGGAAYHGESSGSKGYGKGYGGKGATYGGSGGKGGGGKGGGKAGVPFWRQFVDPSDDPEVIAWCREQISQFLASGEAQREVSGLANSERNTLRHLAPTMGCGWVKVGKGVNSLVRLADGLAIGGGGDGGGSANAGGANGGDASGEALRRLVGCVKAAASQGGGKCAASSALKHLSPDLIAFLQVSLHLRGLKELGSHAAAAVEMRAQGVRLNQRGNGFVLDGVEDDGVAPRAPLDLE